MAAASSLVWRERLTHLRTVLPLPVWPYAKMHTL